MSDEGTAHCRLCAQLKPPNELANLHLDPEKRCEIIDKLTRLNSIIDFEQTNLLPTTVCHMCIRSLNKAFEFVVTVEHAQITLTKQIFEQKIKKEIGDSDNDSEISTSFHSDDQLVTKNIVEGDCQRNVRYESDSFKTKHYYIGNEVNKTNKKHIKIEKSKNRSNLPLWSEYSWKCAFCETQFPVINELQKHLLKYHQTCNVYRCTDCNIKKHRLDTFLVHVRRHHKHLKHSCYKCFIAYPSQHYADLHLHYDFKYVCDGCNTSFPTIQNLEQHSSDYYKAWNTGKSSATLKFTCELCNQTFQSKRDLSKHMSTHSDRPRSHICEVCGKGFLSKNNLTDHLLLHVEERPYQCEICKSTFKSLPRLRAHIGVHDGTKPFSCEQCGRQFRLNRQLKNHSIIHTDQLPFVCSVCSKRFRFKTILNQHIRQHTGVKPYHCQTCLRDFTNWPNYNKHMKRKHGMEMAKKKHTPDGVYPVDPITGAVMVPEKNMAEYKKAMSLKRQRGRPKMLLKK